FNLLTCRRYVSINHYFDYTGWHVPNASMVIWSNCSGYANSSPSPNHCHPPYFSRIPAGQAMLTNI
ncbi:MAG: hypothetical protein ACLFTK_12580, partial [Anaerolineales bacterium]